MSLLAPIICDNGTGYSKVGYVQSLAGTQISAHVEYLDMQATLTHPCKQPSLNAC